MLIDLICERIEGAAYNPTDFTNDVKDYCETFECYIPVYNALLSSSDDKVKEELCKYIDEEWYGHPRIKDFIRSVPWLL